MSLLLRKINNRRRWDKLPWLEEGKAQADALSDLQTTENKLSVWHVEDDKSNLPGVVIAIAAKRHSPSKFDYALFDQNLLTKINVRIEKTVGDTYHREANASWHRDIVELSAEKNGELANLIMEHGTTDRMGENEVISIVKQAAITGVIDVNKLDPNLREGLGLG